MTIHLQTINSVNAQSPESQDFLRPEVIQKHAACTVLDGGNIFKHAALLILGVLLFRSGAFAQGPCSIQRSEQVNLLFLALNHWTYQAPYLFGIPKDAAAGVKSLERTLFDATEGTLREILQVQRIDDAVHSDEELRLLAACVDTLEESRAAELRQRLIVWQKTPTLCGHHFERWPANSVPHMRCSSTT